MSQGYSEYPVGATSVEVITQQPLRVVPWQNSLLGSCQTAGIPFCLGATFCTPCAVCWLSKYTGEHCCVPICMGGVTSLSVMRTKLRMKFNLEGDLCSDCLPLTFCPHCFMCQTKAEWDRYVQGGVI